MRIALRLAPVRRPRARSAYADQRRRSRSRRARAIALAIAPAKIRAPYDVQVIRENGETLPTYALKDRFYVQGNAGERYIDPRHEPDRRTASRRWSRSTGST